MRWTGGHRAGPIRPRGRGDRVAVRPDLGRVPGAGGGVLMELLAEAASPLPRTRGALPPSARLGAATLGSRDSLARAFSEGER